MPNNFANAFAMSLLNYTGAYKKQGDLWEYRLVVFPDDAVGQIIEDEKRFLHHNFFPQPSKAIKPYISIGSFLAKEIMEETLERWIQNICQLQTSFEVTLNNFSGFPSGTIYLRVQDHGSLLSLAASLSMLDGFIQANECPPVFIEKKPHLPIAYNLPSTAYDPAIKAFAGRSFFGSFRVDKIYLLKTDAFMKTTIARHFILPSHLTPAD